MPLRAHQLIVFYVSGVVHSSLLGGCGFFQRFLALPRVAMEKTGDPQKGCVL